MAVGAGAAGGPSRAAAGGCAHLAAHPSACPQYRPRPWSMEFATSQPQRGSLSDPKSVLNTGTNIYYQYSGPNRSKIGAQFGFQNWFKIWHVEAKKKSPNCWDTATMLQRLGLWSRGIRQADPPPFHWEKFARSKIACSGHQSTWGDMAYWGFGKKKQRKRPNIPGRALILGEGAKLFVDWRFWVSCLNKEAPNPAKWPMEGYGSWNV